MTNPDVMIHLTTGKASVLARVSLEHSLHEGPLGSLQEHLQDIIYEPKGHTLCLAYHQQSPIGVCVLTPDRCCMIFVRPSWRQKKVGSRLLTYALQCNNWDRSEMWAWHGNDLDVSTKFWNSQRIELPHVIVPTA